MKNKKGFTLIEALIVVAMIGIVLAIAIPNLSNALKKNKARELEKKHGKYSMPIQRQEEVRKEDNEGVSVRDIGTTDGFRFYIITDKDGYNYFMVQDINTRSITMTKRY